jgi:hypothetical protein
VFLQSQGRGWLKTGAIEKEAEQGVERERTAEPDEEPVGLLASTRPDRQRLDGSCGNGSHGDLDKRIVKKFCQTCPAIA